MQPQWSPCCWSFSIQKQASQKRHQCFHASAPLILSIQGLSRNFQSVTSKQRGFCALNPTDHDLRVASPSDMCSDVSVARKGPSEWRATGLTHLDTSATRTSIRSRRTPALVCGSAPAGRHRDKHHNLGICASWHVTYWIASKIYREGC